MTIDQDVEMVRRDSRMWGEAFGALDRILARITELERWKDIAESVGSDQVNLANRITELEAGLRRIRFADSYLDAITIARSVLESHDPQAV